MYPIEAGKNIAETCLLAIWCTVLRWRECYPGFLKELGKHNDNSEWKMPKAEALQGRNTDVSLCGGLTRSSVEIAVMAMKRRG